MSLRGRWHSENVIAESPREIWCHCIMLNCISMAKHVPEYFKCYDRQLHRIPIYPNHTHGQLVLT